MKSKLGEDTAIWLHGTIRGEDTSEVNSRTQIKSMLSAKSFRPTINTHEQAVKWMKIFTADIYARLVEDGVTENKRRPKTMTLHHRQGGQTWSRQTPISSGKKIDAETLFDLAKTLLAQVISTGRVWPCANLSLSVGGFEDGITGNRQLNSFFTHEDAPPEKRRKLDRQESTAEDETDQRSDEDAQELRKTPEQQEISRYFCTRCQKSVANEAEHTDWHFAKDLQAHDRSSNEPISRPQSRNEGGKRGGIARETKVERGQKRLAFG